MEVLQGLKCAILVNWIATRRRMTSWSQEDGSMSMESPGILFQGLVGSGQDWRKICKDIKEFLWENKCHTSVKKSWQCGGDLAPNILEQWVLESRTFQIVQWERNYDRFVVLTLKLRSTIRNTQDIIHGTTYRLNGYTITTWSSIKLFFMNLISPSTL